MCYLLLNQDFLSVLDVDASSGFALEFTALEVEENILLVRNRGHGDACFIVTEDDSPFIQRRNPCAALIVWVIPVN